MSNKISQVSISQHFLTPFGRGQGFADFVSVILFNAVALAAVILLFLMIAGGIMMIAGAGSGNKDDVAKGKKALTSAIVGFLIIFVSYWVIVVVQNIFGFNILNP